MMITSKQRAFLRGLANKLETILQVGKGGVTPTLIKQVDDALTARELIKLRVLETSPQSARDTADALAAETGANVVQTIGTKFVLYRKHPEKPEIILPKA